MNRWVDRIRVMLQCKKDRPIQVLVKCPRCEQFRYENYQYRQVVMPRVFCKTCVYLRNIDEAGEGYVGKTKKAGRKPSEDWNG